jgi:hypothetical protein
MPHWANKGHHSERGGGSVRFLGGWRVALSLLDWEITDAGLVHLTGLGELRNLSVSGLPISDHGLVHLKRLTNLKSLTLRDTQITDADFADLQKALPNCKITR